MAYQAATASGVSNRQMGVLMLAVLIYPKQAAIRLCRTRPGTMHGNDRTAELPLWNLAADSCISLPTHAGACRDA